MRLTRVYVETALTPGSLVELPPDTASHLAKVLRARSGDECSGTSYSSVTDETTPAPTRS